ncbi:hypothetical protein ACJMK2_023955 [Sinanodonta woodiana]|uniref:Uncharacterized protein n=1 Tax=Sinanodonta woodiana TaxID=1069815 RepID=A0ABD3T6N4_SINWO
MAEDGETEYSILKDLQSHLRTANVPLENLSTLAQQGDDRLVEEFLTENIKIEGSGPEVMQSQLYIASFWGMKDMVQMLLHKGADPNHQNKGTKWTPLHAATFQEHGPVIMALLEHGAKPDMPDAERRTPIDFASASDKIWPHFAILRFSRTSRAELVDKKIIRPGSNQFSKQYKQPGQGIRMAASSRPESTYAFNSDPFIHAAVTGDVLADDNEAIPSTTDHQPQFSMWQ